VVFGRAPTLGVGDWIRVNGSVGEYRGKRQLLPVHSERIMAMDSPTLDTRSMRALSKALLGQWITVRGQVDKLRPIKGGMLLDLKDRDGGAATVAMFEQWYGVPFSQTLAAGDTVIASGELANFHGQLEVQPELSIDLVKGQ
jgi:DNA/RNA endonuclease YhcR with UshA esterase domain